MIWKTLILKRNVILLKKQPLLHTMFDEVIKEKIGNKTLHFLKINVNSLR